ncbi:MAG: permease [Bdellovibrio sp. CG12_big_fil_rev_8_21_14_0_65_39_13]|nr:MAG: permease [Bdellovibrio sp. CG22_combo_CG10-13_8_21_14_all_39_27]PIQ58537.1 MAG: permease [Bdellovibrio sp. CG12_big_fil_rev_8_21_14_0_65_39_13]PIR34154.1 MAG: permease [Bdellovibrio sp. CG11_big_fil_rev_8_21_14_0_20_39_38]
MSLIELILNTFTNSSQFLIEVFKFFPPILILMGLLEAWIPKDKIETHLGHESGIKGMLFAIILGSAAAGPLFAAFPIAKSLSEKGVRAANTVIFLCSWATIKIPILIMESSYLGIRFSLLRLFVTLPFILLMGLIIERLCQNNGSIFSNDH